MRLVFCCAFLSGIMYFLGSKRRVDFFAVGFFGGCFYFLPGLFGFVFTFNRFDLGGLTEEILPETYLVMTLVLVSLVVSAFFFDRKYGTVPGVGESVPLVGSPGKWAALLATTGFAVSLLTTGRHLLDEDKGEMLLFLDRWSILWEVGAAVGLVLAFARKDRWVFRLCGVLLLADWVIGFRASLVLAALSVGTYVYHAKGAIRFVSQRRAVALVAVLGAFGFFVSGIPALLKAGELGQIKEILSSPDYYVNRLLVSESFNVQTTLNEVIATHFRVGAGHLSSLVYVLVPFGNELGSRVVSFNDLFQERLFPGVGFGLAGNIWAQAWSIGGLFGVTVFILTYIAGLWHGSKILHSKRESVRAFAALFFVPWAFYLYRNDLLYQLVMERRIVVMYVFVLLIAVILGRPALGNFRQLGDPSHSESQLGTSGLVQGEKSANQIGH